MRGVDPVVTPPSRGRQDGLPPLDRGHHPLNNPGHSAMDGPAGGLQQLRTGGFGSPPRQVPADNAGSTQSPELHRERWLPGHWFLSNVADALRAGRRELHAARRQHSPPQIHKPAD